MTDHTRDLADRLGADTGYESPLMKAVRDRFLQPDHVEAGRLNPEPARPQPAVDPSQARGNLGRYVSDDPLRDQFKRAAFGVTHKHVPDHVRQAEWEAIGGQGLAPRPSEGPPNPGITFVKEASD